MIADFLLMSLTGMNVFRNELKLESACVGVSHMEDVKIIKSLKTGKPESVGRCFNKTIFRRKIHSS